MILFSKPMEQSFCKTAFSLYFSGQITLDYCVQFFYILEGPNNTGELGEKKKKVEGNGRKELKMRNNLTVPSILLSQTANMEMHEPIYDKYNY